jgi:hypothetical protein
MNAKLLNLVLELDKCSIHHRVELNPETTVEYAKQCQTYNGHNNQHLQGLVEKINKLIPPMNFPSCNGLANPNNGRTHHNFEVGNEGSRVIYLRIVKAYLPKNFNYDLLASNLCAAAQCAHADETHLIENNSHAFEYRFWWD